MGVQLRGLHEFIVTFSLKETFNVLLSENLKKSFF
jgi:hypothetical protein